MNLSEFDARISRAAEENPVWFALERDPPATELQVARAQEAAGIEFPEEYKQFLARFGGGLFAFSNIFSVSPESEWFVVERNRAAGFLGGDFLAVSENGVGDHYGFVRGGGGRVYFFDHETRERIETNFANLFEYLDHVALTP